jgi:hypothetical protein
VLGCETKDVKQSLSLNIVKESITLRGFMKKSERLVVAKKRSNVREAKGPYFSDDSNNIRSSA